jgi:hypothetical protein
MNKFKSVKDFAERFRMRIHPWRKENGTVGYFHFAHGTHPVSRISLCNHLITLYGLTSYLEIGTRNKADMNDRILAPRRASVDPDPRAKAEYVMTSDDYFAKYDEKFDIIFIDGLHTGEQVRRDIDHALQALTSEGMILLHDLNPPTAFHAREEYEVNGTFPDWNGTSWEGFAWHRKNSPEMEMYVVDTDWGVGFLRPGLQKTWNGEISGYPVLAANRKKLLNLISVREFLRRHPI